jgi:hypothetical protein
VKRTSPLALFTAAVLGLGAGFLVDQLLTAGGRATFTPAIGLPILLVLLGLAEILLALPIRRATRATVKVDIDPFRAVRIAVLAKASSLVGAVVAGFALGLLLFVSTRPATPDSGALLPIILTAAAGVALVVTALVAEHLCTLRKDDDDDDSGPGAPAIEPHRH